MTDTIDERLSKLQAKLKISYDRIEKTAYHKKMQDTKKQRCGACNLMLFESGKSYMWERKLICERCYNLKIKVDI